MVLVFNEISISSKEEQESHAHRIMSEFLSTYTQAQKTIPYVSRDIISAVDLNSVQLYPGYFLSKWRNSLKTDRDEARRFLGICQRQRLTTPGDQDSIFVHHKGTQGLGLQIAYETDNPLISFSSSEDWEQPIVENILYDVNSDQEEVISQVNLYSPNSLTVHNEWFDLRTKSEIALIQTEDDFLSRYQELFPSLDFHPNALAQIRNQVSRVNIPTIVQKLRELEKYFSTWDGQKFDRSVFPPRFLSPESEKTLTDFRDEHTFEWKGESILVSYHVRYTGGNIPGRIYIYPEHNSKRCLVVSLHEKLPTASDPKF